VSLALWLNYLTLSEGLGLDLVKKSLICISASNLVMAFVTFIHNFSRKTARIAYEANYSNKQ